MQDKQGKLMQVYTSEGKCRAKQSKARKGMAVQGEEGEGKVK
jgi:hypothetical protein